MQSLFVDSEIGRLNKVLVHRPDSGISRVSPKQSDELLFDDIVYLPDIQKEHDVFADVLRAFVGEDNVVYVETLIEEALQSVPESRDELLKEILDFEELPSSFMDLFSDLSIKELTDVLITGYVESKDHILFDPIPNFIFTRDIAVVVRDHIIITKAAKEARHRENLLTHFILSHHPMFEEYRNNDRIIDLNDLEVFPPSKRGESVSIEGGDMMILQGEFLLIGCSERTSRHAIASLRKTLFEKGVIKNVVEIKIPADRSFMHIDTIFTQIRSDVVVGYKPIIHDGLSSHVIVYGSNGTERFYSSVEEFFIAEINAKTTFIYSGNGTSPYQEREQWTDGCNLVALKEGVAIAYDRNIVTEKAFFQKGFYILSAEDLIYNSRRSRIDPWSLENTIITIPSSELSRARGGSRCLTCPLSRAPWS